ncbi:DegT/DnrJ/EryC1/StrS family aminotransferase [Pelagibacterales bacterium SAG-MED03]|nr:DegT/DnrJ/EryC1/StrS family aminotransferase [Pelagibacterales bacterium SAG-MED03]
MKVNYNYLKQEFSNPKEIINEWKKLIKSTDFTLGKYVAKFESSFSKFIGSKYCISTNNGTDALILCLKALNVKPGDEVITVVNTFYATVGAIEAVGATPVFCDCDERYQIDINDIKKKITKKTKVIMPVHWGGASPDMFEIMKIAKLNNLKVVEDACMGIGASLKGKSPGSFGHISAFSLHPLKSLNAIGDGGAVVTNDKKMYKWLLKYRNHGMIDRDTIDIWGVNKRMQPLQCVVALWGLKKLKKVIQTRNQNAAYYDKKLKKLENFITIPKRVKDFKETYALYMVLCKNRDKLKKFLEKNKIEVKIHYPKGLNNQPAFKKFNLKRNIKNFKVSDRQAKMLLTIPVHQFINKKQQDYVIDNLSKFYKV